ncbi:hypothetical protein BGW39_005862 [Mortierella sp. 14UC]|nr:hypothetical protein BGW39_005862 [Mortierella sp. 14UC]
MSETYNSDLHRKSNIRIGLDPSDNGMVDVLMPYDGSQGSSILMRRPSAGATSAKARAGGSRSAGPYAVDSLMTEQEMVLDLESDTNQRTGPLLTNWPAPPGSRERTGYFDTPPPSQPLPAINATGSKGKGTLQKSPSVGNHIVYVPPPLPPPAITTPASKLPGVISPYADEAMIIFPPDSPPRPLNSGGDSKKTSNQQAPVIRIGEAAISSSQRPSGTTAPDDEPSFLDLNNSLTVDRYKTDGKLPAKDRTSVNSFFSGLAMDEPTPESYSLPPILPEPSFASEEYVMPAPIARVIPVPTSRGASPSPSSSPSLMTVTPPQPPSSSSSSKSKSAYERRQEEIQVASCFAQDLGFEIVHPSPNGSPRHKAATPTGSRRL